MESVSNIYKAQLSDKDFQKLAGFITRETGIKMPLAKKVMLQSRLKKRLTALNITSFSEYTEYVLSKDGLSTELIHMLDAVSTNKTDFFREAIHFEIMRDLVLPEFAQSRNGQPFKAWSAGCSSGEEPYNIAMVIDDFLRGGYSFDYQVRGSDISTAVLRTAINGVYTEPRIAPVPKYMLHKYFMRSKDKTKKMFKVVPEIRKKVQFSRINFMDDTYKVPERFDAVFCRNVLIYFDRPTQEAVVSKLLNHLKPGGYFFIGHSESLIDMNLPLKGVRPTVFRKIGD
ncbi:MAG: CheR family methyltransferase [Bacteroidota bacterium]